MKEVVRTNAGYVTERGDQFAYHRQMFHEVVRTIQKYGGCAHAMTNDARTVFDMCNDEDLLEKMKQDIKVTCVSLTLSQLAAAAIRKHQVQYHDKLPTKLINLSKCAIETWNGTQMQEPRSYFPSYEPLISMA